MSADSEKYSVEYQFSSLNMGKDEAKSGNQVMESVTLRDTGWGYTAGFIASDECKGPLWTDKTGRKTNLFSMTKPFPKCRSHPKNSKQTKY